MRSKRWRSKRLKHAPSGCTGEFARDWGFADPDDLTMADRLRSRYRGRRYSFGYAACPNLDDQYGLFELLRPQDIGVTLTDGAMMEPEASVSALVFHHPDCIYFDVNS